MSEYEATIGAISEHVLNVAVCQLKEKGIPEKVIFKALINVTFDIRQ